MYTIKCDNYTLYDHHFPDLKIANPKAKLEVNTVGEASFTIHHNHPYYDKLKYLKSVFEISDEIGVIFRGRMTNNTLDFYNGKAVDLEGSMAYFNDSIVKPFVFPEDFLENEEYITASESGNVVEFFLKWLIDNHNSQVQDFQKFKLGTVTVTDPNNYLSRSSEKHDNTWNTLKSKLFDSSLGGYLCIRYEADGNYIDYVSEFTLTNTQKIVFAENLLDLKNDYDASETFTAMIPIGATVETEVTDATGEKSKLKTTTTIETLPDETIAEDIVKSGDTIYSKSAVEKYGWIYAPISESTFEDVTDSNNLLNKSIAKLTGKGQLLSNAIEFRAVDLHFTNKQIQSFRMYRNVVATSEPHGQDDTYPLLKLELDFFNAKNIKIAIGRTQLTLTDTTNKNQSDLNDRVETVEKDLAGNREEIYETYKETISLKTYVKDEAERIVAGALVDYVEKDGYEEFKQRTESELSLEAGQLKASFEQHDERINTVGTDLQSTKTDLEKHFIFDVDGLVIRGKDGNDAMKILIDNDIISFTKNGQQFGWWDGVDFHTGNIVIDVNEKAQFGGFAFVPRSDGSLSFLKVGG